MIANCGTSDDREIEQYLTLCAQRIQDLKKDARFKYVSVIKNFGTHSGQDFDHPTYPRSWPLRSFRAAYCTNCAPPASTTG